MAKRWCVMLKIYYIGLIGTVVVCVGAMFSITPVFKQVLFDTVSYDQTVTKVVNAVASFRVTPADKSELPLRQYAGSSTVIRGNGEAVYTKQSPEEAPPKNFARARLAR